MSIAGAIDISNNIYTSALNANKGSLFKCVDCDQRVILRKGEIRLPHFAHYSPTNTCTYFEHPSESQKHKDAKMKLAEWLKNRNISIYWSCHKRNGLYVCGAHGDGQGEDIIYDPEDIVVTEYRDPNNKYIADIAVLKNGNVKYIFEIMHTHKTITSVRPEPWYEISAEEILEESVDDTTEKMLQCLRNNSRYRCLTCGVCEEPWVENIPSLSKKMGQEHAWCQEKVCILCKRDKYNPVYNRGKYKQICKICISNNHDELRDKYELRSKYDRPLFR